MNKIRELLELPDKAKCVAIPTGGEHDQMKWVYVVKRDQLQSALEAADLQGLAERVEACAVYLKDGETPAECIQRNRNDVQSVMKLLAKEKQRVEKLSKLIPADHPYWCKSQEQKDE